MAQIEVKLADPTKIVWDQETGLVITGDKPVKVEETWFIHSKIAEGVLVNGDFKPKTKTGKRNKDQFYEGIG
jgi:flagellar basal body P-ring protein FlgI